jgi:alkylation response protein AidB-like acyl-CoA dehydrogenase
MDFSFAKDDLELRDGAREYLRGRTTREALRELVEEGSADLGSWPELADMGLTGFLVPEECGGLGLSSAAFALVAEEAGYVATPEPLVDVAAVAAPVLAGLDTGRARDLLAAIVAGSGRVLTSHPLNPYVNQLSAADSVLLFTDDSLSLASPDQLETRETESIDPLRRLTAVECTDAEIFASGETATGLAREAAVRGAVFTAAELLGLAAAMIDMSTEYASQRKQFGAVIGTFQAVKHHLSTAFTKLEFARPAVYRAAARLDCNDASMARFAAHAKLAAGDAAIHAAEAAIQVHGGIGYTFEADLHLWMKRAWALTGLWGDRNHHFDIVDRAVFEQDSALGPGATFPGRPGESSI